MRLANRTSAGKTNTSLSKKMISEFVRGAAVQRTAPRTVDSVWLKYVGILSLQKKLVTYTILLASDNEEALVTLPPWKLSSKV